MLRKRSDCRLWILLIFSSYILTFNSNTVLAQSGGSTGQENTASLKETVDWLKDKLLRFGDFVFEEMNRDNGDVLFFIDHNFEVVKFDGCIFEYRTSSDIFDKSSIK